MSRGKYKFMEKYFTISQTAQMVNMTTETLRHYDRIGLIKPCKIDKFTSYRYYSKREIVRLNTISALRCMDFSLNEIKEILEADDFELIINFLKQAETSADNKIAQLKYSQSKIKRARLFYESKMDCSVHTDIFIKNIPQRVILLSENIHTPTLENLWDYHRHFYDQVGSDMKGDFSFEDLAGIYEIEGQSHLFAVCTRYSNVNGLKFLPRGQYLCSDCTEKNREEVLLNLLETAKSKYAVIPEFTIQLIVLSGILQWNYQIQIFVGGN